MSLSERQGIFSANIAQLILFAKVEGARRGEKWYLTFGEAFRSEREQEFYRREGRSKVVVSQHQKRLAVDFNFFVDGEYQQDTLDYEPLGRHWKLLHPLNRWGGDWGWDGNHFEMRG